MSVDKLVDSAQLDADLTSVANAIRTKGGTSASLAFPADFVSAIAAIPSGGASQEDAILDGSISGMYSNHNITYLREQALRACGQITGVCFPAITSAGAEALESMSALLVADLGQLGNIPQRFFQSSAKLATIILRKTTICTNSHTNIFQGTKYANGGAGGDIYVPSNLISSYQSSTNWATQNSWGTITWKAIEGSQYENYYADGTPVS